MQQNTRTAVRVSVGSIIVNLLLSLGKLVAGLAAASGAMISDAVHSASDVFSTLIVLIGVRLSSREADQDHPYGHERLEDVAAIVLAVTLFITGLFIGVGGVEKVLRSGEEPLVIPGIPALIAAGISILVKEIMFWVTRHYARAVDSQALMADAWHHRSDALSSVGALVGIAGARMGFPVLDPLASIVICAFILKAAVDIFREAINKMVDHRCDPAVEEAIRAQVLAGPGVAGVDLLRTREFGNRIYVELEISVDGTLPLTQAHAIAEGLHQHIEESFPKVKHIMIHVNPVEEETTPAEGEGSQQEEQKGGLPEETAKGEQT